MMALCREMPRSSLGMTAGAQRHDGMVGHNGMAEEPPSGGSSALVSCRQDLFEVLVFCSTSSTVTSWRRTVPLTVASRSPEFLLRETSSTTCASLDTTGFSV